jgi:hypothetical protein
MGSLEGTFLGSCVLTGRVTGQMIGGDGAGTLAQDGHAGPKALV